MSQIYKELSISRKYCYIMYAAPYLTGDVHIEDLDTGLMLPLYTYNAANISDVGIYSNNAGGVTKLCFSLWTIFRLKINGTKKIKIYYENTTPYDTALRVHESDMEIDLVGRVYATA